MACEIQLTTRFASQKSNEIDRPARRPSQLEEPIWLDFQSVRRYEDYRPSPAGTWSGDAYGGFQ